MWMVIKYRVKHHYYEEKIIIIMKVIITGLKNQLNLLQQITFTEN